MPHCNSRHENVEVWLCLCQTINQHTNQLKSKIYVQSIIHLQPLSYLQRSLNLEKLERGIGWSPELNACSKAKVRFCPIMRLQTIIYKKKSGSWFLGNDKRKCAYPNWPSRTVQSPITIIPAYEIFVLLETSLHFEKGREPERSLICLQSLVLSWFASKLWWQSDLRLAPPSQRHPVL